ncbi:hypothetical protein FVEN_g9582 [Fusarium venenatum]|uniref:Mid2 domain-containing protein n=1 Tax=Fusarium venenatum TaxID=56646 RepID=A0A2L2TRK2_9HYPO|nr:uncharacterized protein FVRRES_04289 [Fusarium venenatum]KAG8352376.1 hypothetical protein FVEN_g9582 [Fusarium venenatum]KAH7002761.1 hypothetical protein EDB82DRAFT_549049 [Fusarium venenatum]CEI67777.1 unnamed protein product [Fusarium venenatum]
MHCINFSKLIGLFGLVLHKVVAAEPEHVAKRGHDYILPRAPVGPHGLLQEVKLLEGHGVKERQVSVTSAVTLVLTVAPDETCGYLSGSVGVPITCENGASCTWEPNKLNIIACGTDHYLQCVESKTAADPKLCDDVCQSDTWNLLCTNSDAPYCRTYLYPSGVIDYRCASTSVTANQRVEHTFEGDDNPNFITTTLSDDVSTISEPRTVPSGRLTDGPTKTTTTTNPGPTSTTAIPPIPPKPTPVGAIVGGVVGGLAVLGLITLGIIFALRRRKPKPTVETTLSYQPNLVQQPAQITQKPQPGPPHQYVVPSPYPDPSMAYSSVQPNTRTSMFSGSVSPIGPASPMGWSQHQTPAPIASPAPAYEVAGPEARQAPSIHELGADTTMNK